MTSTSTGDRCQNPATEGDHCWIEAHGSDASGHGRPSKLEACKGELLAVARLGMTSEGCARVAGISTSTLYQWRTR